LKRRFKIGFEKSSQKEKEIEKQKFKENKILN
jgi:hypothetical protein